ncbi:GDSL-type esterase/lipase family protein [Paenibacillus senegalimassiliensis]|uniref:GDSL-type esterase/lipase family protein n=1 Tax=Paenibacillus senegalimassiliensis TaxID=1737426 RepID=UPI00073EC767|nr:GDSL-type esterase/lipase family protein [Paenibacillus senegalimassiliensis]
MKSASRIWRLAGTVSALSTLLLLGGFIYAVTDIMNPSAAKGSLEVPSALEEHETLAGAWDMTVIGDSLAKGTGDDTGKGFARRSVELLQEQGHESKLINNLGINGLDTEKLLSMLDDPGVRHALQQAGIIVLSIGGNDLFDGTERMASSEHMPTPEEIEEAVSVHSEHYRQIVAELKEINTQALLVYVGLYNPFSDLEGIKETGNDAVARWNRMAQETLNEYEGTLIVPTYDLFTLGPVRYLASDHFHPNADGYQAIAERMVQGLARE